MEVNNGLLINVQVLQLLFAKSYQGIMHGMLRELNVNGEEAL